jgi:hypothetical protein
MVNPSYARSAVYHNLYISAEVHKDYNPYPSLLCVTDQSNKFSAIKILSDANDVLLSQAFPTL